MLTRHLLDSIWSRGGREKRKRLREEKQSYSKSYPFHAFQITLQQRVQSEYHIVAEALELEEDRVKECVWRGWTEQKDAKGL